jgi:metallophosphoesterase (TIGR03767 family)
VSGGHPPLTTDRRLGPGAVLRRGSTTPYRAVQIIEGERHLIRDDFGAAGPARAEGSTGGPRSAAGRPLGCLVHITDLQLADVQSPARFEFLNRYFADPRYAQIVPVQRPQEALTAHAVDATVRTLNAASGPATGAAIELAVTTGDAIDNAQWNEVQAFLGLFDGGLVAPNSGGPGYAGVQALDWPDDIFWKPDGVAASGPDFFRRAFGFPHHPGLLDRAVREFSAAGLRVPWLSCFGNHEALDQGVGIVTEGLAEALVGTRKPVALPEDFNHDRALQLLTERPEAFMAGPATEITADPGRRAVTRQEFVQAHFRPGSRPFGHGFSEQNRLGGTAYYVYDTPAARFIALDTTCLAGGAAGCLDRDQARWLEARLAEVHSAYRGRGGREVATGHDDRLVVLFSHHGTGTLSNTRAGHPGPGGERVLGAADLLALLHRFPNVVLWLNGHTHANSVQARRNPDNPGRGFWEVTTCAVIDWPCQTRIVELVDRGGYLSIVCTMVDHDTPAGPRSLDTTDGLASLHRELAANVPLTGAHHSAGAGTAADRNVELRIAAPFPLGRVLCKVRVIQTTLSGRHRPDLRRPFTRTLLVRVRQPVLNNAHRLGSGLSDQCRQPGAFSLSIAVSLPSSLTCAATVLPSTQRVSSAGLPVTVTTGVLALAVIRTRCGPGSAAGRSSLTSSMPTGALRSRNLAILSRCHSTSVRSALTVRCSQPGAPRRTSSWCTKYSTTLARWSMPGIAKKDSRGGPFLMVSTSRG